MFVKVKQTRHTKIGTLRPGVLDVSPLGERGREVVEALMEGENPPVVKLTKKQAETELAKVKSLVPEGSTDEGADGDEGSGSE
ncbi:hypothetical protein KUV26_03710 [Leisingera daeponensis]|uniref:Mu-like prophage FluMu N-terminal domain-containing protein n=1 Tax=Leisingera daeponensis TaxID=405746 RepID=A0ABS7NCF2_9RHOB|nr:hypothetical protein [Leisingera daeponensis]MBY6138532.1 hypothetical protein [Leisingera daeponensis]